MKKELIGIFFLVVLVGGVSALPVINSVGGNFSDGENVMIGGGDFGANGPIIYRWDDFEGENYIVGQSVRSCNNNWSDRALSYPTLVSDSYNRAGSTKHTEFQGAMYESDSGLMYVHSTNQLSPVFMTCYRRVTTEGTVGTMKWEWIVDSQNQAPRTMHYDLHSFGTSSPTISSTEFTEVVGVRTRYVSGSTTPDTVAYLPDPVQEGQWVRAEYFGIESDPGVENGTIWHAHQVSDTGTFVTLADFSGGILTRQDTGSTYWDRIVFGWYTHGNTEVYDYDDIYIADSRARVEIGNNQNFSLCTHREIQIPQQWADGSITFNVNQGSFSDGETAYVFVVDENGTASEGYPINISGEFILPEYNETCGNSYCNATAGENCTTCSQDCGNCTVTYATPHVQDYITLQEMLGSIEDYKRGLTPIEQVVANIKKFIWG